MEGASINGPVGGRKELTCPSRVRRRARRRIDRLGHLGRPATGARAARRRPGARSPRPGLRMRDRRGGRGLPAAGSTTGRGERAHRPERLCNRSCTPASRGCCGAIRSGRPGSAQVVRRLLAARGRSERLVHQRRPVAPGRAVRSSGDRGRSRADAGCCSRRARTRPDDRDGYHGNEILYHACEFPDPTCARLVIEPALARTSWTTTSGSAELPQPRDGRNVLCARRARRRRPSPPSGVAPTPPADGGRAASTPGRRSTRPTSADSPPLRVAVRWGERGVAEVLREAVPDEAIGRRRRTVPSAPTCRATVAARPRLSGPPRSTRC